MVDIKTVGVIGAGQMGSGIAHVVALGGYDVLLHDVSAERIDQGIAQIEKNMARQVSRGVIEHTAMEAAIARIEHLNPHLNAVVTKVYDQARGEAAALDRDAPFAGVPFLLKDLGGALAGVPLTGGSRFFANAPAPARTSVIHGWMACETADRHRTRASTADSAGA